MPIITLPASVTLPAGVSPLATKLSLSRQGLAEVPEWVAALTHLVSLRLIDDPITELPAFLALLPTLRKLILRDCPIETLPAWFCNMHALEILDISGTKIQDIGPLFEITSLKKVAYYNATMIDMKELKKRWTVNHVLPTRTKRSVKKIPRTLVDDSVGELLKLERKVLNIRKHPLRIQ